MKIKFYSLLILLFSFLTSMAQRKVTGHVSRENSTESLQGVTVTVKGSRTSTATNNDGNFSITVPNDNAVLVFTSVGFKRTEMPVGSNSNLTVSIAEDPSTLTDVVVVGYQSMRRKDLLASVASVSAKDLKDIPINSAAEALNGRLAGVTATTSEGSPDATIRIRVRGGMSITGNNDPLFIVDGVQVENGLSTISPQDIQTIDVLKDAAATAIYGARGANGVIVITTKAGRAGRLIISYNGFVGVKNLAKKLKVLSPYDYVFYQSERSRGSSQDSTTFLQNFGTTWDTLSNYRGVEPVDWQDIVFGNTGITTTHNVSASGGNNKVTYNLGYTFNNEKAIVINSRYQRHIFNLKADYKLAKKIKLGVSGRYNHQDTYGAGISSDQGSSYSRLRNAVKYRPFLSKGLDINSLDPIADPNVGNGLNLVNPLMLANAEYQKKSGDNYNGSVNLTYNITKNLSFRSIFGYDHNNFINRAFSDSITPFAIIQGAQKPIAQLDTSERKTITNSNVLTYSLKGYRQKHDFDFLLGEETYDLRNTNQNSLYRNFPLFTAPDDAFKQTSLGTPFAGYPRMSKSRYTSLSFFSRVKYTLLSRYMFEFNVRADGASKFAPGRQWGFFPAASIGWNVTNEEFMKDAKGISDLKFRFGFGTVGNNRINDYLFLTTFSNNGNFYYGLNNQSVLAYYPTSLVNPLLQWESTVNRNIGVDMGLFSNRLTFSIDYYNNASKDLLLNVPIDPSFGYTTQLQNIGKTSNKGIELQLNAVIIKARNNLNWNANFNISHNSNKIVALGVNQQFFYPSPSWGVSGQPTDYIEKIGEPVGSMYGLITDGFYKVEDFNYNTATSIYTLKSGVVNNTAIIGVVQPGSIKFKDLNGDGVIDINNDRTIIGNPTPKFTGGLNQQFTLKQWDASVFVNFSYGNDVYNANKIEFTNGYTNNANLLDMMETRWKTITPTGQTAQWANNTAVFGIPPDQLAALNADATIWQPLRGAGAFYPHSWAIEDGSFLRLNNVTLGYSLPVKSLVGLRMSKLRFYVTGNNLAIITNYTGYDPEVSVRNSPLTPGLDYSAYPKSRSFIFGINASF
ncbi:MAG TPA: TonB-dependent receptor [Chitinophagaceae bacterium]|nr:TonB-dependent receptor [Chitinophagaceae bacterium]